MHRLAAVVVVLWVVVGCTGDGDVGVTASTAPTTASVDDTRYRVASATVLESPDHGPELCLGGVASSYPPQCGGISIANWDWALVDDEESAGGTTWAAVSATGTYDGAVFTVTDVRAPGRPEEPPRDPDRFRTPCPEPDGGWDFGAGHTGEADLALSEYVQRQPDFGAAWVDRSFDTDGVPTDTVAPGGEPFDERLVHNVSFTGDLDRHRRELESVFDLPLCVSLAPVSAAELHADLSEAIDEVGDGFLAGSPDAIVGRIEIHVVVDDGIQDRLDDRFGPGYVVVTSALVPAD